MKSLLIGLAALGLGSVGLGSSTIGGCEFAERTAPGAASPSVFGFSAIGTAGRWAGSPA